MKLQANRAEDYFGYRDMDKANVKIIGKCRPVSFGRSGQTKDQFTKVVESFDAEPKVEDPQFELADRHLVAEDRRQIATLGLLFGGAATGLRGRFQIESASGALDPVGGVIRSAPAGRCLNT